MVAELKDTMDSKYFPPPALLKDKYSTWQKEIKILELVTSLDKAKKALMVFLSLEGKAREAVLELDTAVLNSEDGMKSCMKNWIHFFWKMSTSLPFEHTKHLKIIRDCLGRH